MDFNFSEIIFLFSGINNNPILSSSTSILAILPWSLTRISWNPKDLRKSSAFSTLVNASFVILRPYGNLEERQGEDGLFHVGRPSSLETSRIFFFEKPASMSGLLTPCFAAAFVPGLTSFISSILLPSITNLYPSDIAISLSILNLLSLQTKHLSGVLLTNFLLESS